MKIAPFLIAASSAGKTCEWTTYCSDITATTTVTNSWTCRDCFNVRLQADLNHVADGNWFSSNDSIYVAFDEKVSFIKAAGPVDNVAYWGENDGSQIYEVTFLKQHEFGDRRVDSNIEFKRSGLQNIHAWTLICPCGVEPVKVDPCVPEEAPLDDFPSRECRSKRKGKKLVCGARCDADGKVKAKPNTIYSCLRESNNKPVGEWFSRNNRIGKCATDSAQTCADFKFMEDAGRLSWADAREFCTAAGGDLPWFDDFEELDRYEKLVVQTDSQVWLGISRNSDGDWETVGGEPLRVTNWLSGQPDNYYGNDHCGETTVWGKSHPLGWNDHNCANRYPVYCRFEKKVRKSSKRTTPHFRHMKDVWVLTWADAAAHCAAAGGALPWFKNQQELDQYEAFLNEADVRAWLGVKRNSKGVWENVNGKKQTVTNWLENQPDNYQNNEACAEISRSDADPFGWNDHNCEYKHAVVCRFEFKENC